MSSAPDIAVAGGLISIFVGLALFYVPAALVVAGIMAIVLGITARKGR